MTKALIGTLCSGENEYEDCLKSIQKQTFQSFDHLIIRDLPELEAHRRLFSTFMRGASQYDLLIKVDADMVLISETLFADIARRFVDQPDLKVLSIRVQDFFTDSLINGLQAFRNNVTWNLERDTVFPDIPDLLPSQMQMDNTGLEPAAWHCPNPSELQAFHYGVHRGLKSIQKIHSTTHWAGLERVWKNFTRTTDKRLGLAVLGAELVYAGKLGRKEQNYTHPAMVEALASYQTMDSRTIKQEILKLRACHGGFLPADLRRRILRELRGKRQGGWDA